MKKIILAAATALALSTAAHADSTAILKVTGLLSNAACTPELSNGGIIDYGHITLAGLSPDENNYLNQQSISLTITCTSQAKAAWTISDDRADSNPGPDVIPSIPVGTTGDTTVSGTSETYGVGKTAGEVSIGAYALYTKVGSVTADGVKADAIYGTTDGTSWQKSTTGVIKNGNEEWMTVAASGTTEPVAYTTAVFPLGASLTVRDTTTLAITDDTNLDGQATITLKYL